MSGMVNIIPTSRDGRLPPGVHWLIDLCIAKYTGQMVTESLANELAADVQKTTGWRTKGAVYQGNINLIVMPDPKIIVGGGG